jgi:hypothetical protein
VGTLPVAGSQRARIRILQEMAIMLTI